jgi:hypothetical protein
VTLAQWRDDLSEAGLGQPKVALRLQAADRLSEVHERWVRALRGDLRSIPICDVAAALHDAFVVGAPLGKYGQPSYVAEPNRSAAEARQLVRSSEFRDRLGAYEIAVADGGDADELRDWRDELRSRSDDIVIEEVRRTVVKRLEAAEHLSQVPAEWIRSMRGDADADAPMCRVAALLHSAFVAGDALGGYRELGGDLAAVAAYCDASAEQCAVDCETLVTLSRAALLNGDIDDDEMRRRTQRFESERDACLASVEAMRGDSNIRPPHGYEESLRAAKRALAEAAEALRSVTK